MQYPLSAFFPHVPISVHVLHAFPIICESGMPPFEGYSVLAWMIRYVNGDAVLRNGNQHYVALR